MKFGIVVFPGSNCDDDMVWAVQDVIGHEAVKLWHKDSDLQGCDFLFLPGGFSYGDYLRSGAIARFSPIMKSVIDFANAGGPVMGICNGFQILTEAGLLPGALLQNNHQKYTCKNIYLKVASQSTALTQALDPNQPYRIPIAHGEGRYHIDAAGLKGLKENDQILFHYCDQQGNINPGSNPNGSVENIAGVCNTGRNVFGMMPHPERAADLHLLGNADGRPMLESLLSLAGVV